MIAVVESVFCHRFLYVGEFVGEGYAPVSLRARPLGGIPGGFL